MSTTSTHSSYDSPTKNRFIGRVLSDPRHNVAKAARAEGIHPRTGRDLLRKFNETGSTHRRPTSGRPESLTPAAKRRILREVRKDRRAPLGDIGNRVGASTTVVRRYLDKKGYHRRKAKRVVYLTPETRKKRLDHACEHIKRKSWRGIAWSDECYIIADGQHGAIYVTRRPDEKYNDDCVVPKFKQSKVRVMVWACIMHGRKGPIIILEYPGGRGGGMTAARYIEQVLEGAWKLFSANVLQETGRRPIFQQDGASAHTAKVTLKWFTNNSVTLLPHPPSSPDLSPIENLWDILKTRIAARGRVPTSQQELEDAVREAWDSITTDEINHFIAQMPDRLQAVINAQGGHTKY
jgi:transposase